MDVKAWAVLLILCCAPIASFASNQWHSGKLIAVQLDNRVDIVLYLPDQQSSAAVWSYSAGLVRTKDRIALLVEQAVEYKLEACKKDHSTICAVTRVRQAHSPAPVRPMQEYTVGDYIVTKHRGDDVKDDWVPRSFLDWSLAIAAYRIKHPEMRVSKD
jgi:hypothetical protein